MIEYRCFEIIGEQGQKTRGTDRQYGGSSWPIRALAQQTVYYTIGPGWDWGPGSILQHTQNAFSEPDMVRVCVMYQALRDITAGEELYISYGEELVRH